MEQISIDALLQSLRGLQHSGEYSDLKIFCGDEVFDVHKAVICPRSKLFTTSCKGARNGKLKDKIILEDEDPTPIRLMVDYLYQLDYDDSISLGTPAREIVVTPDEPDSPVANGIKYFEDLGRAEATPAEEAPTAAPELEIEVLPEEPAVEAYEIKVSDDDWGNFGRRNKKSKKKRSRPVPDDIPDDEPGDVPVARPGLRPEAADDVDKMTTNTFMYALGDKYTIDDLKALAKAKFAAAASQDWESQAFVSAAKLVFETTPNTDLGLRAVVTEILNEHRTLMEYPEVQDLLDSGNGMAWSLLKVVCDIQPHSC